MGANYDPPYLFICFSYTAIAGMNTESIFFPFFKLIYIYADALTLWRITNAIFFLFAVNAE